MVFNIKSIYQLFSKKLRQRMPDYSYIEIQFSGIDPPSSSIFFFTYPPSRNSNKIVKIFAAITGTFKYSTACNKPMICVFIGLCEGSHPILFTWFNPYFARTRCLFKISAALVQRRPTLNKFQRENPISEFRPSR